MSEQTQDVDVQDAPQEVTIEDQAIEMGWRPKEEFKGATKKWVSAETFVARAPLFEKIEELTQNDKRTKRQMAELTTALKELADQNKKVGEAAYNRAMADLKAQRKAAADLDEYDQINEQIEQLKESAPKEVKVPAAVVDTGVHPEFKVWLEDNAWYNKNTELREYADIKGKMLMDKGISYSQALEKVAEDVRKTFKDEFQEKRTKSPSVESPNGRGTSVRSGGFKLTEEQERACDRYVKRGVMTRAEYIEQIKLIEGQ